MALMMRFAGDPRTVQSRQFVAQSYQARADEAFGPLRLGAASPELPAMTPLRELSTLITRHVPDGSCGWTNEALGLRVSSTTAVRQPTHIVYQPVFALIVQGEKELVLGEDVFTCRKG